MVAQRRAGERTGSGSARRLILFAKARGDQRAQRIHRRRRFLACGRNSDGNAGRRGQHHQAHDRGAADAFVTAGHDDGGVELFGGLHEFGRGAGVQALLVDDFDLTHDGGGAILGQSAVRLSGAVHLPVSTRLAIVQYLRPASWAAATACSSGQVSRTLASLISIGRLMPASTSTLGWLITEIARLEGVPPNMSVRMATPLPLSTRLTASRMFLRHCSMSSSGPMVTASIWRCGPTTCSSAERNSMASRPWVTNTRPIIPNSSRALRCTARMGAHSGPSDGPLQGLWSTYRRSGALREGWAKWWAQCTVFSEGRSYA